MNTDTLQILTRKGIVLFAGWLFQQGWITSSGEARLEDVSIGVIAMIISFVWAKLHVAQNNPVSSNVSNSAVGRTPLMLLLVTGLAVSTMVQGCSTNAQQASLQAASGTDAAVRTAMIGWGAYVSTAHPGTNTEAKVKSAFDIYRNSELAVIDASAALLATPTSTNAVSAAVTAEQAAQVDLLNIISSLTNSAAH